MPNTAQVLIVSSEDTDDRSHLSELLSSRGFTSADTSLISCGVALDQGARPDVIILDLLAETARKATDDFVDFARKVKAHETTRQLPVIVVKPYAIGGDVSNGSFEDASVDEILSGPLNELQLCGRVNSLVRLNTMHEELVRRLNTSAKYGIDAPTIEAPPTSVEDATILVVGATETFPVIEKALCSHAALVGALTTATALDYLSRRSFDAVIVDVDGNAGQYLDMCRAIRRNSRLFNIPIVLLSPLKDLSDPDAVFAEGVSDIITKPVHQDELERRVGVLVRELRFRDSLRAIYKQARHMATSDGLTGLYSRGFFLEHLRGMIEDMQRRGRSFSVSYLMLSNIAEINDKHGYIIGDRVIRQVGEMMGMLVRGEDLTARYGGGEYGIILPDTAPDAALVAIRRITGVVKSTKLSTPDLAEPVSVDLIASVIGYDGEATPEEIVAEARSKLS